MFRTVWSEKLVLPAIGLAAQDATQPPLAAPAGACVAPVDAAAGTTAAAAAPRASAVPPRTAASRLLRGFADGNTFCSFVRRRRKFRNFLHKLRRYSPQPYTDENRASMAR